MHDSGSLRSQAVPVRHCPRCGKRLARLNSGPTCYACAPLAVAESSTPTRSRRTRLPHDEIIELYREIGHTSRVAARLDLPRSSVWYVIQRARQDGRLDDAPSERVSI
jgi:hypothetical protein